MRSKREKMRNAKPKNNDYYGGLSLWSPWYQKLYSGSKLDAARKDFYKRTRFSSSYLEYFVLYIIQVIHQEQTRQQKQKIQRKAQDHTLKTRETSKLYIK